MVMLATDTISLITMRQGQVQRIQHHPTHGEEEHQLVLPLQREEALVAEPIDEDAQREEDERIHHY